MALKTYSRQRKTSQPTYEPPSKRRRVASPDAPSFSDDAPTSDNAAPAPVEPSSPLLQSQSYDEVSELALPSSTPPSSPPAPPRTSPSPILLKRRPAFSFLARKPAKTADNTTKKSGGSPLQPRSANDVTTRRKTNGTAKKQTRLTQLQLDLGTAPVQKTCSTCGMAHVPSNSEDAALHKVFHAQNVGGVELGRGFVRGLTAVQRVWEGPDGDCVVVVSRRDGAAAKNRVARVMEVVRAELGAIEIAEAELWSQVEVEAAPTPIPTPKPSTPAPAPAVEERQKESVAAHERVDAEAAGDSKSPKPSPIITTTTTTSTTAMADRYKAYLYVRGTKCIGLCLAERISSAQYHYHHDDDDDDVKPSTTTQPQSRTPSQTPPQPTIPPPQSNPPTASTTTPSPALSPSPQINTHLGISRIWTSSAHRRAGVGSALLDAAARCFVYGYGAPPVPKNRVAFSQPTQMGRRLAEWWVGGRKGDGEKGGRRDGGLLVYW
ncbi:ESCO1/2 acetyl-transferase-domain-containing protein [Phyllosticta citrichinensis]|uniref:ESCO1/2 acetyl-transferase-domain-containing protein n=1 Tax=Phyllosticta citrichinensis TaxID=1130410 RepID=A0ABR1Y1Z1_9PEZI